MKKRNSAGIAIALMLTASLASGCGIVTVVPIGQEAQFTGAQTADVGQQASDTWASVAEEIVGKAEELSSVAGNLETGKTYAVKFSGKVSELNTDTPKGYLKVDVDGVDAEVRVLVGSVIPGTTVRDCQTVKAFQDFTNQTEWSEYGRTLNKNVLSDVIEAGGIGEGTVNKDVEVVGCFKTDSSGNIVVTPVSVTVK
ncbi:MAG: DUF2291 family protein [Lachnospiraceae bacterium]|nr:DUF2291 family protein [Lachnospiraceae bacterium]